MGIPARLTRGVLAVASTKSSPLPPPQPLLLLHPVWHQLGVSLTSQPCRVGIPHLSTMGINRIVHRARWVWLLMVHIPALGSLWKPGVHISADIYVQENNAVL